MKNRMSTKELPRSFSIRKAHEAQRKLCKKIIFEDKLPEKIRYVAGIDAAYDGTNAVGAAVVLEYDSLELVEQQTTVCPVSFPYVTTLLSFREMRSVIQSIRKLKSPVDVFFVDAHGYSHPYRCGFASHLGLVLNKPTIGVAKKRLIGEADCVQGDGTLFLQDNGEIIGAAVVTRPEARRVYVSVGHMISLETAVKLVKHCVLMDRLPIPIVKAHSLATEAKRKINISFDPNNQQ